MADTLMNGKALQWVLKPFFALTPYELYEILRLRQTVFIVEQNCPYLDNDGKDLKSFHLMGYDENGKLITYSRLLPAGLAFTEASIGRVVTDFLLRGTGAGKLLMVKSIEHLEQLYGKVPIRIGAQYYLLGFYQSLGFIPQGNIYLEDGIEHIEMLRYPI